MELNFYDKEHGFHIDAMCTALAHALKEDDMEIGSEEIRVSLYVALGENHIVDIGDFIPEEIMFLVFADMAVEIGHGFGYQGQDSCDALAWADDFKQFKAVCAFISDTIVQFLTAKSAEYEAITGYGFVDVYMRSAQSNITPQEAASQLSAERNKPTFH